VASIEDGPLQPELGFGLLTAAPTLKGQVVGSMTTGEEKWQRRRSARNTTDTMFSQKEGVQTYGLDQQLLDYGCIGG